MKIRFGTLDTPLGRKASRDGFVFLACVGDSLGTTFEREWKLESYLQDKATPHVLKHLLREGSDAAWVRARLPRVFGYAVTDPEVEKTLFWETFVAVRGEDAVMFTCADYYGRTGLSFAEKLERETKTAIAGAFWDLLLEDPEELADYELRTFHLGVGVWLDYSCKDGVVAVEETPE